MQRLKPLLEKYNVSAYLAGHDHCAQHIDEGKGVQYHGIGAGVMCDPTTKHKDAIPSGFPGTNKPSDIFVPTLDIILYSSDE